MAEAIDINLQDVPTRKPRISVVIDEELLQYLEQWAEAEERSVSNLVLLLLRQAKKNRELEDKEENKGV